MPSPTAEENKRIVRRIPEEVATQGRLDVIDEIFAEELVDHTPIGEFRGRQAAKEVFQQFRAAFPDLSVTIQDMIAEEDTVAVRVTWHATHKGEFMGIEPTDREVTVEIISFLRLKGGKVTERWIQPDQLGLMRQIGALEPPGGKP